jgi:hypothetical protein
MFEKKKKVYIKNNKAKSYYEGFNEMENIKDLLLELKRYNY